MPDQIPDPIAQEIRDDLDSGNKIAAIKRYRELTGLGLAEAKAAIEAFERGATLAMAGAAPGTATPVADVAALDDQILASLVAGNKIAAIKTYRQQTGLGLYEAKQFIDALEAQLRTDSPKRYTAPPAKGCGAAALLIAGAAAALCTRLLLG
jgi:ribosomal protein L7/L12